MVDPLQNMKIRSDQYRRLADLTLDRELKSQLRRWADEVDADIAALEAERRERES